MAGAPGQPNQQHEAGDTQNQRDTVLHQRQEVFVLGRFLQIQVDHLGRIQQSLADAFAFVPE